MFVTYSNSPDFTMLSMIHAGCFSPSWSEEALVELFLIPGTLAFVAQDNSGFGILRVVSDEAEIITISVLPQQQRTGVGKAIMTAMLESAKKQGVQSIFLEVRESNAAARGLYVNSGFSILSRRKHYYRNSDGSMEDAVVMRKVIE